MSMIDVGIAKLVFNLVQYSAFDSKFMLEVTVAICLNLLPHYTHTKNNIH